MIEVGAWRRVRTARRVGTATVDQGKTSTKHHPGHGMNGRGGRGRGGEHSVVACIGSILSFTAHPWGCQTYSFRSHFSHREKVGALDGMVASTDPGVVARDRAVPQHHQVSEPASLAVRQLQREVDPRPRVRDLNLHLPLANGVGAVNYFRRPLLLIEQGMSAPIPVASTNIRQRRERRNRLGYTCARE